jgi:prolyl oligopeptidase
MPKLMEPPPHTPVESVTEILHGVPVTDPYRWLEDQGSSRTRAWIRAQTQFARSYLDAIPGRDRIRARIHELLDVETCDSLHKVGNRYFFRKRLPGREQPSILFRDGREGTDQLLVDPAERRTGECTSVRPLRVSPDGRLLLYEIKEGGERTGTFEFLEIETRKILPDVLPRGYLRGFAFAADSSSFYYSHELAGANQSYRHAAYRHLFGTDFRDDAEIFVAGENERLRLHIVPGKHQIGFLLCRFRENTFTDFYLWRFQGQATPPEAVIRNAAYMFAPVLLDDGRILAVTDCGSRNFRIVEVHPWRGIDTTFTDLIAASDVPIQNWLVTGREIVVSYIRSLKTEVEIFDLWGNRLDRLPSEEGDTVRIVGGSEADDEIFLERESFTNPIQVYSYATKDAQLRLWARREVPFESRSFAHVQVWFPAMDGVQVPMFLVGQRDALQSGSHPVIMTSYGGYGVSMTPQFSVFVAFLIERGCLFALPNIRGGSEFGVQWHISAQRRNRQVAFNDFLAAAEWLVETGRTQPRKLAIFGGSNSGLLVGAAMTQRPDLFRAVVCMVPMLDMLRYHLFDDAYVWKDEFGTADDPKDFPALFSYSPYHRVRDGVEYPATLIVSGDSDQNCNPLHARKMTARLQAANVSDGPVLLSYSRYRGHSAVLPLTERINALTDRMAFLCDLLELPV